MQRVGAMAEVDAVVLVAGGPTGFLCAERLIRNGKTIRAVVRDPAKYRSRWPTTARLQVVKGDVTDLRLLEEALNGFHGNIFAASTATCFGAQAVDAEVMVALKAVALSCAKAAYGSDHFLSVVQGVRKAAKVAAEREMHLVLVSSALVVLKNRSGFAIPPRRHFRKNVCF